VVRRHTRESGAALIWALLALTAIAAAVLIAGSFIDSRQVSNAYEYRSVVLTTLSDAAMAETLAELEHDPAFTGMDLRRFGDGSISSSVGSTPLGLRLITAVGEYGGWKSVIRAEVTMEGVLQVVKVERVQVANR